MWVKEDPGAFQRFWRALDGDIKKEAIQELEEIVLKVGQLLRSVLMLCSSRYNRELLLDLPRLWLGQWMLTEREQQGLQWAQWFCLFGCMPRQQESLGFLLCACIGHQVIVSVRCMNGFGFNAMVV